MRQGLLAGESSEHVRHCFNLLRQAVLCASDTTLDPLDVIKAGRKVATGADGVGTTHVCRDWTKVYDFVWKNQRSDVWAEKQSPEQNITTSM